MKIKKQNANFSLQKNSQKIFDKKIDDQVVKNSFPQSIDYFFSPTNAAQFLDVSVKMIYELIQSGELKCQPLGRRIKRIRKSDLEKWLSSQVWKDER